MSRGRGENNPFMAIELEARKIEGSRLNRLLPKPKFTIVYD